MGIETTLDHYAGFSSNIPNLLGNLLNNGQLSEEQRSILQERCSNLENLTAQQCAEIQRDLASWTPCWKILEENGQEFGSDISRGDWREGRFYEVLIKLTGEKSPKSNLFVDEATQFIDKKRIVSGERLVGVTIAHTVDDVNRILSHTE